MATKKRSRNRFPLGFLFLFLLLLLSGLGSPPTAAQTGTQVPVSGEFVRNGTFDYASLSGIPLAWWAEISPGYPTAVVTINNDPVLRIQPPLSVNFRPKLFVWQEIPVPETTVSATLSLNFRIVPDTGSARLFVQFETDTGRVLANTTLTSSWYATDSGWVSDTTDLSTVPNLLQDFNTAYANGERVRLVVGYERDTDDNSYLLVDDISLQISGQRYQPALTGAIAFVSRNNSGHTVEWIRPNGQDRTRVWQDTRSYVRLWDPRWRPDGREIAFASDHELGGSPYLADLYAVRPDGSGLRRITNPPSLAEIGSGAYDFGTVTGRIYNNFGPVTSFFLYVEGAAAPISLNPGVYGDTISFSIDAADLGKAQYLVFTWGDGNTCATGTEWEGAFIDVLPGQTVDIGTVNFDGTCSTPEAAKATWRQDGQEIGFALGGLAKRALTSGETLGRDLFSNSAGIVGQDLEWSPIDANQILFQGESGGTFGIFEVPLNGTSATSLVLDSQFSGGITEEIAWLPDGSTFLYTVSDGRLYEYNPTGADRLLLALNNEHIGGISVSPDGNYVVFERTMGPLHELWILDRLSPNVFWPLVPHFATDPDWSRTDPVFPVPSIRISDVTVTEGNSGTVQATFTITLSEAVGRIVTVDYATADGTATAGSDYQAASGTLTFNPGETSKTIAVAVYGDTTVEPDETFYVNLSNPTNATLADGQAVGTIQNDDSSTPPSQPQISINDVTVTEGNSGTVNAVFTVSLSQAGTAPITVDYATANGTATAGSDYQAASGTLTFNPGETSKTIAVAVYGDTTVEPDETFYVNLSNPTNATIADGQAVGTIRNDDSGSGGGGGGGGSHSLYLPTVRKP